MLVVGYMPQYLNVTIDIITSIKQVYESTINGILQKRVV